MLHPSSTSRGLQKDKPHYPPAKHISSVIVTGSNYLFFFASFPIKTISFTVHPNWPIVFLRRVENPGAGPSTTCFTPYSNSLTGLTVSCYCKLACVASFYPQSGKADFWSTTRSSEGKQWKTGLPIHTISLLYLKRPLISCLGEWIPLRSLFVSSGNVRLYARCERDSLWDPRPGKSQTPHPLGAAGLRRAVHLVQEVFHHLPHHPVRTMFCSLTHSLAPTKNIPALSA